MSTKFSKALLAGLVLAVSPLAAHAVVISDINMDVRASNYSTTGEESISDVLGEFNSSASICDVSLDALDNVGSVQTCGGPNRNLATLFEVAADSGANEVIWQFGADWGRGGFLFEAVYEYIAGYYDGAGETGDLWWNRNWNDADVIEFYSTGAVTIGLLGFEGCCGGGMSLRYSTDNGESWQIAAVNVPAPGTLALIGLALCGAGFARRKNAA